MGFIGFDLLTGFLQALITGTFKSSIMRKGLLNKLLIISVVAFTILVDFTPRFFDIGFSLPIFTPVCVYIVIMELASIVENLRKTKLPIFETLFQFMFKNNDKLKGE